MATKLHNGQEFLACGTVFALCYNRTWLAYAIVRSFPCCNCISSAPIVESDASDELVCGSWVRKTWC